MRCSFRALSSRALACSAIVIAAQLAITPAARAENTHQGGGSVGKNAKGKQDGPDRVDGMVCPTKDFWVGDGFGADRGSRKHLGIDLGGDRGLPIFAVEDGRIDRTKKQDNGALQIVMRGVSGSKFYYGHMDDVYVKGGQKVRAGDVIGTMGDTGSPGAVHLHFEYWKSGGESDAIDPRGLISRICKID